MKFDRWSRHIEIGLDTRNLIEQHTTSWADFHVNFERDLWTIDTQRIVGDFVKNYVFFYIIIE